MWCMKCSIKTPLKFGTFHKMLRLFIQTTNKPAPFPTTHTHLYSYVVISIPQSIYYSGNMLSIKYQDKIDQSCKFDTQNCIVSYSDKNFLKMTFVENGTDLYLPLQDLPFIEFTLSYTQ